MPIYAYKCGSCGHARDVLQKLSDSPLTDCPACGAATFSKQLTAAGFQLKGTGWYATDFRSSGAAPAADAAKPDGDAAKPAGDPAKPAVDAAKPASDTVAKPAEAPAAAKKPDTPVAATGGGRSGPAAH